MKKPDKNTRPKAEKVSKPELDEVLSKLKEDTQHRIDMLSSISAKAADVLKFALTELKAAKENADRLNSMKIMDAVKVDGFDDAVDYVSGVIDDEVQSETEEARTTSGRALYKPSDETDSDLVQFLFKASRFAIDPGEMRAYRHPELDGGKDRLAYEFVAVATMNNHESTFSYQESFIAFLYPDMKKTVELFDEKVDGLNGIRFMTKEEDAINKAARKEAVEYYDRTEPVVRKLVGENKPVMSSLRKCEYPKCRCHRDKKVEAKARKDCPKDDKSPSTWPLPLSEIKKLLLGGSRYRIPVKRFKVVADRVDRKSRKYVYELRFFQKDYTKTPADTQSYERAAFRLPMKGHFDLFNAIARFDKAVSELRFNEFKEKKNVR